MRHLTGALLRDLARHEAPLCLSLYVEVAAGGGEHRHVELALKNAQSDGKEAVLAASGTNEGASAALVERLEALTYDDFVGAHDRRLAVFMGPDLTETVDTQVEETGIHVGPVFRLAPLLGELDRTPDHALLVASRDEVHLYRATSGTLTKLEPEDMPASFAAVSAFTDPQEKGNIHGREDSGVPGSYQGPQAVDSGKSGTQGLPHHSMGGHDWRETKEDELRCYAERIIKAVQHHLSGTNLPLVVAADERLHGMIRQGADYPHLVSDGIHRHPRDLDEEALREAAADCVKRETAQRRKDAWETVAASLGRKDQLASTDTTEIVTGAAAGRVAQLFVRTGASVKGRFNSKSLAAECDADGNEDLVDRAIVETLRNSGEVFALDHLGEADWTMAAGFRYPA